MIDKTFSTTGPVRLTVRLHYGDIEVTSVDAAESTVEIAGPQRVLDAMSIEQDGDRIAVQMQRKLFGGFSHRHGEPVRVRVTVPHRSRLELASAAGETVLDGTFDRVSAQSAAGEFRAGGEIVGDATVKTVSSHVRLAKVGGDLTAHSVSGNVIAEAVGGSVSAKSVSGHVSIGSVRDGRVDVQSVSGDVEVGIAHGTNVDVDAVTASGTLSSEVPLSGSRGAATGPTVVVRGKTVSGDVRLFRAA
ncbi:MAG TPA: DUF4097 family beta strand repeat-containing protein [Mycobacteriales bacterium]|nr:DUF4097 family beta strand repeat-containing protein [Mycobacteriales bacterium]HWB68137.1 DUF4097 family beta strand repeat-containing protein [Mycobacteriales bacterium]